MATDVELTSDEHAMLLRCETVLDYHFTDRRLLRSALVHASSSGTRLESNERLEFLGDAILGMVASEMLFQRFPQSSEGDLTEVKSKIVSRTACARVTRRIGLQRFMLLGKGIKRANKTPDSLLANVFESVIAAIYLDGGFNAVKEFVGRNLEPEIEETLAGSTERNFKSELQQYCQRVFSESPTYDLMREKGPDHNKMFAVVAVVGSRRFALAWGSNKKHAEQRAAANALAELDNSPPPYVGDLGS